MCVTGIHHTCRGGLLRHRERTRHQYALIRNVIGDRLKDVLAEKAVQSGDTVHRIIMCVLHCGWLVSGPGRLTSGENTSVPIVWEGRGGGCAVVKALRYKPAGRGFDSRWCH
jgi:hypothetical protein